MSYLELMNGENESIRERYGLVTERIKEMAEQTGEREFTEAVRAASGLSSADNLYDYFMTAAGFLCRITNAAGRIGGTVLTEAELRTLNRELYRFLTDYESSYTNPRYAGKQLGIQQGQTLAFLFTELHSLIPYVFEERFKDITIGMELFVQVFNCYLDEEEPLEAANKAIYYHFKDYCMEMQDRRIRELLDPDFCFAAEIIMESDLSDLRYLYRFGEYISDVELDMARFLNSLPEADIEAMAETWTEGYRKGFENNGIDLSGKSTVNIRYTLGFERIIRAAIGQFAKMGLRPTIYRAAVSSLHKKQHLKIGYSSTGPCRQYDYDHRFDEGLYLNRSFLDRKLSGLKRAYETYRELAAVYAGPAVMEIFGQQPFMPEEKSENVKLTEKQQKLTVWYQTESNMLVNQYVKQEEVSFTIMAFPIPQIGKDFKQIFMETVRVNTLDVNRYQRIQQALIDALDKGEYVYISGMNGNHTGLKVMLKQLSDPAAETKFENCLADVNIPVGEVFTSPVLEGTEGILHVKEAYLNDLKYTELFLEFRDGCVTSYECRNFEDVQANRRFIKENLMYQHETLPIGEFAIGTNTAAYRMGKEFGITSLLPVLIAEKTGPHFAVGDTCYKMSEDNRVYNPDGKEITAKENSFSALRKTKPEEAYFNCHTDITLPYDELGEITVWVSEQEQIPIIRNGRFVLKGTEELNGPLME